MKKLKDLTLEQLVQIADEPAFADNLASGNLDDAYADNVTRHVVFAMLREAGAAFLGLTYIPRGAFLPPLRHWEGERLPHSAPISSFPSKTIASSRSLWTATPPATMPEFLKSTLGLSSSAAGCCTGSANRKMKNRRITHGYS